MLDPECGGMTLSEEDRLVGLWAHAAAREAGVPVATAAARAAAYAAATTYIHALATPHRPKHALGAALYQAQASAFLNISSATLI